MSDDTFISRHEPSTGRPERPQSEGSDWLEKFTDTVLRPGPNEEAFFESRRALGLGVGLSESGEILHAGDPS